MSTIRGPGEAPTFHRPAQSRESLEALVRELRRPEIRQAILSEEDTVDTGEKFETMGALVNEMLEHPATVLGLGDGGAHLATICDASMPTDQLSHWAKGRARGPKLPLERAVQMQTKETAALYGLSDRGILEVGKRGDVSVIDLDRLALQPPRLVQDLPANSSRLLQGATGYRAPIVGGVVVRRDDCDTGERPGRLVRGAR